MWSAQVKQTLKAHIAAGQCHGIAGRGQDQLITALIARLRDTFRIGVIEGRHQHLMTRRPSRAGHPQRGAQHGRRLPHRGDEHSEDPSGIQLDALDVLFVENIGNLVCPAEFDIGENLRITILSVPEGDDKVEKYPLMFTETDCLVLNKADVLPYFDFDLERVKENYHGVNPGAPLFAVSARSEEGLDALCAHLRERFVQLLDETR